MDDLNRGLLEIMLDSRMIRGGELLKRARSAEISNQDELRVAIEPMIKKRLVDMRGDLENIMSARFFVPPTSLEKVKRELF
jgi:hypothetical protein